MILQKTTDVEKTRKLWYKNHKKGGVSMFQWFLNLFRPLPDENVPRIREMFSFLIEDYGFSFATENLGNAVDADGKFFYYGPVNAYYLYRDDVCINILYLRQRDEYSIYITDSYQSDQVYIRNGTMIDGCLASWPERYAQVVRTYIETHGGIDGQNLAVRISAAAPADVEVIFKFNGVRQIPARSGYRPAHDLGGGMVIGGIHHYFDVDEVAPDGTARGTIAFFTPEALTASIQCGMQFPIREGARVVGKATVVKVLNPVLKQK